MSIRSIVVLILAVVCGLSAAIGMGRLRGSGEPGQVETTTVVVAKTDIPRGEMIKTEMLTVADWPSALIPAHSVAKIEDAVDRATAVPILKGDVVLEGKLASKDAGRGVAALIPPGMRAFTIQTAKVASNVAGFVLPGNRVDVLLTLRSYSNNDDTGGGSSMTILQAVEILAINQRLDAPAENRVDSKDLQSVTLLVAPSQVEVLDLGQNLGTLTLSLRNLSDREESKSEPATLATLLRIKSKAPMNMFAPILQNVMKPVTPEPPQILKIRTLRGSTPGEIVFEKK